MPTMMVKIHLRCRYDIVEENKKTKVKTVTHTDRIVNCGAMVGWDKNVFLNYLLLKRDALNRGQSTAYYVVDEHGKEIV